MAGHRRALSGSGAGLEDRLQLVRPFRPGLSRRCAGWSSRRLAGGPWRSGGVAGPGGGLTTATAVSPSREAAGRGATRRCWQARVALTRCCPMGARAAISRPVRRRHHPVEVAMDEFSPGCAPATTARAAAGVHQIDVSYRQVVRRPPVDVDQAQSTGFSRPCALHGSGLAALWSKAGVGGPSREPWVPHGRARIDGVRRTGAHWAALHGEGQDRPLRTERRGIGISAPRSPPCSTT